MIRIPHPGASKETNISLREICLILSTEVAPLSVVWTLEKHINHHYYSNRSNDKETFWEVEEKFEDGDHYCIQIIAPKKYETMFALKYGTIK